MAMNKVITHESAWEPDDMKRLEDDNVRCLYPWLSSVHKSYHMVC